MKRPSLSDWIAHVFDHAVTNPAWHWEPDAPEWEYEAERDVGFITDTFEHSGELLKSFSDEQLEQGFWFLVHESCSKFMYSLVEPKVALTMRLRALHSFVPLFEQVMAARCSPHLSHLEKRGAKPLNGPNPLNGACYMWWDNMGICGRPDLSERAEFDSEVLVVLKRLLKIPHDACRESALHGLGHWTSDYPSAASSIIAEFLSRTSNLRPELIAYAQAASIAGVQ